MKILGLLVVTLGLVWGACGGSVQPVPTHHPCSLIKLPVPDEMHLVYRRYMAADSSLRGLSRNAREALEELFWEIAAAYILETIANPIKYSSFREYLGEVGYTARNADLKAGIETLQSWDLLPYEDESLQEYEQRRIDDPCTPARLPIFADDELTTVLAIGYARNTLNPFLQAALPGLVTTKIDAFRFNDVTTPLFIWWLHTYID